MEVGSVRALASRSARPAWYDPDRLKRIDRFAALVERGPLDLDDTLRLCLRWSQLDHLALDVEHIARADRRQPDAASPRNAVFSAAASSRWKGCGSNSAAKRLMSSRVTTLSALLNRMPIARSSNHSTIKPPLIRPCSIAASQFVPPAERSKPAARTGAPAMALTTTHRRQRSAPERRQASGDDVRHVGASALRRGSRFQGYRPARFLAFTARLTTFAGHCPVSTRRTSPGAPA